MDLQCSHFFLNVYFMWNMFSKWGNQIFFACSFPHWFWYCNAWQKNHSEMILLRGETVNFGFHKGVLPSRLLWNVFSVWETCYADSLPIQYISIFLLFLSEVDTCLWAELLCFRKLYFSTAWDIRTREEAHIQIHAQMHVHTNTPGTGPTWPAIVLFPVFVTTVQLNTPLRNFLLFLYII